MTSSYSVNRDNHFWSSLRYGQPRIRFWDYGITDIAEGENVKGCSWYTTLKTLKVGKTRLATHKSQAIASWHCPHFSIFASHFSAFTINKPQNLPLWKFPTSPFEKMLGSWYPEFVHIHVFMGIHETINNNQEDNTKFVLYFILSTTRT